MRPSLFFFLLPFLLFSCAKSEEAEEVNVQTYASGQLSYPESPLSISQTTRDQFISKSFSPWTTSAEVLLGQLESFPGKSTDYLEKYLSKLANRVSIMTFAKRLSTRRQPTRVPLNPRRPTLLRLEENRNSQTSSAISNQLIQTGL